MKRVVVISDSHCQRLAELPAKVVEALRGADMIVHAGDHVGWQLVQELRQVAPYRGVAGNMDFGTVAAELPDKDVFQVEDHKVGVMHGWGEGTGLAKRVREQFAQDVDVVICGHSHLAKIETIDGALVVNPGSAVGRLPAVYPSYAVLTIDEKGVRAEIVKV